MRDDDRELLDRSGPTEGADQAEGIRRYGVRRARPRQLLAGENGAAAALGELQRPFARLRRTAGVVAVAQGHPGTDEPQVLGVVVGGVQALIGAGPDHDPRGDTRQVRESEPGRGIELHLAFECGPGHRAHTTGTAATTDRCMGPVACRSGED